MKTGKGNSRDLGDLFYISLLGLYGILKRAGLKDATTFKNHNPFYIFNATLLECGICFNLYSEYGVGKKLEHLIIELFKNLEIDSSHYTSDPFYREITHLSSEIVYIVREADPQKEEEWTSEYALRTLMKEDEIFQEREERLKDLLDYETNSFDDEIYSDKIVIKLCSCSFCLEFKKYYMERDKSVSTLTYEALMEVNKKISH